MPITFTCNECGKTMRVQDHLAGRRIKCPACKAAIEIPSPETPAPRSESVTSSTPSSCPSCKKRLSGATPKCPHCGYNLEISQRMRQSTRLGHAGRSAVKRDSARKRHMEHQGRLRMQRGKKTVRTMRMLAIGLAVLVLGGLALLSYRVLVTPELPELIAQYNIPPLGANPERFHPFRIGESVEIDIPVDAITMSEAAPPVSTPDGDEWLSCALANGLPIFSGKPVIHPAEAERVLEAVQRINAESSNQLTPPTDGPLLVWRASTASESPAYFSGIVLHFGDTTDRIVYKLNRFFDIQRRAIEIRRRRAEAILQDYEAQAANAPDTEDTAAPPTPPSPPRPRDMPPAPGYIQNQIVPTVQSIEHQLPPPPEGVLRITGRLLMIPLDESILGGQQYEAAARKALMGRPPTLHPAENQPPAWRFLPVLAIESADLVISDKE